MDHRGQFQRAAAALGVPDDEISAFIPYLRMSFCLSASSGGVPVGQFGGLPRLPVGEDWPSHGGRRLPFVFSVDCAALEGGLPVDGSLLFFLDHEKDHLAGANGEHGYGRVVHVPAGVETAVVDGIAISSTLVAELPSWMTTDEDEDDMSPFQEQLVSGFPHLEELRDLAHELWPRGSGLASAYVGGYADDEVITSFAEQTLAWREKSGEISIPVARWGSHVEKEAHRLAGEWMSLARFPADGEFYYASFVIRHDDLAAGRLDKALSVTEFSE